MTINHFLLLNQKLTAKNDGKGGGGEEEAGKGARRGRGGGDEAIDLQ